MYGKIKAVIRTPSSSKKSLTFDYDASGNRIAKHVYSSSTLSAGTLLNSTYYLRDAQGNNMAVYKLDNNSATISSHFKLEERYIYGSNRLGMDMNKVNLFGLDTSTYTQPDTLSRWLGSKQYEFSNHLGNVLTTISDKKIPRDDNQDGVIDYFNVDIQTTSDYYPFGASMKQRSFHLIASSTGAPLYVDGTYQGTNFDKNIYRASYNGVESDAEISGEGNTYFTENRVLDSRLGRWLSLDPVNRVDISRYSMMSNMPIIMIDPKGDDDYYNEKGKYLYTDTKTSQDIRVIKQDAWNKINQNHSAAVADKNSSNLSLLMDLDANSKKVTIKMTGADVETLWKDSHAEKEANSSDRKEQAGCIVLNLENMNDPSIELIKNDCSQNTNDCSNNPTTYSDAEGTTYLDKNKQTRVVVGMIHTHPNKEGEPAVGGNGNTYTMKPVGSDIDVAKDNKVPVYTVGSTSDNKDMEIDKIDQTGKTYDGYMDYDAVKAGGQNIAKDALETKGNKPK